MDSRRKAAPHYKVGRTPTPKIAIGISYYNDYPCIARCLESLVVDRVLMPDYVILVDGIYEGYPDADPYSVDGSTTFAKAFARKYPWQVILQRRANLSERTKRQCVVESAAKIADFLLILDADEYVAYPETSWGAFRQELSHIKQYFISNIYGIRCVDLHQNGYAGYRPRLWFKPAEVRYGKNHYQFMKKSGDRMLETIASNAESLTIYHDHSCRSQQREALRLEYQENLRFLEN